MRIAAISVRQPWAELIARGDKPIEFRSRPRHYRGPVLIHASKRAPRRDWPAGIETDSPRYLTGAAICIARMVDCRFLPDRGCYGWFLDNPIRIEPFEMKGNLFIFSAQLPSTVFVGLPETLRQEIRKAVHRLPRVKSIGKRSMVRLGLKSEAHRGVCREAIVRHFG